MEFKLEKAALAELESDLLLVGVFQDEPPLEALGQIEPQLPDDFARLVEETSDFESFRGNLKETLILRPEWARSRRLCLVGLGKKNSFSPNVMRRLTAGIARQFGFKESCKKITLCVRSPEPALIQAGVEGVLLGSYQFLSYKSSDNGEGKKLRTEQFSFAVPGRDLDDAEYSQALESGRVIAESTNFARDLIAEPGGVMTPSRLAEVAQAVAGKHDCLSCTILEREEVRELGMGSFLGVAQGSHEPPKFIVLSYSPGNSSKKEPPVVALVGKGITFDSGGLSLKTAQGMETMKIDMSGAAAVIATMNSVAQLKPPVKVVAVVAACENMPGGGAIRPGDVLVAMNGKTIEVNNTDAEGRLTLADALCYVGKEKPNLIIDIATLTGGVVTALGRACAGMMTNNQEAADLFVEATGDSGERFWLLPLFEDYRDSLKSDVADLKNAGARGEAVSSSAGMFLKEFVNGTPWIHLDMLGPGWMDKDKDELNKGGTGFGVRALTYFLTSNAAKTSIALESDEG